MYFENKCSSYVIVWKVCISTAVSCQNGYPRTHLRILTGKKQRQIKLQHLQKVGIWISGSLVHQINSLKEVFKLKQNFQKNKVVTVKTPFYHDRPIFVLTILFNLSLASDMAVLYENDAFSILVLSTKKQCSSFFEKGSRFPENLFQS